ncbi:MAG: ISKra4 family transposase [Candidatus Thorarchaeota archaeon]
MKISEKIANEIMSEIHEVVKDFVSDTIADRRSVSFEDIETRVSELKERFGKRLSEGALEAIGSGHVGQRIACRCGGVLEYQSNRRWILISLNGKVEVYRAYYYCESCKSGLAPLDKQLGLEGKHHSIGVRKKVALEASSEPFAETSKRLKELIGIQISSKESQLESEELGQEVGIQEDELVESFWSEQVDIEPEVTARRFYITADGTIVSTDEGGKEVKIGSVYETPQTMNGLANDIRYTGGFHNSEHFGKKLYVLALRRGLGTAGEVIFIGDGARWIWNLAKHHFPEAVQIVDFYHSAERLWSLGRCIYGEGTKACKDWVRKRIKHLLKGKVELVISSLCELDSPDSTEEIGDNITYFTNNKERMRYDQYRRRGYHIGSGAVESACKHVVGQRLKQAGMRWSVQGADAILQLRILWKNGEWSRFWNDRKMAA